MYKIGLIGAGTVARFYAAACRNKTAPCRLFAVCDSDSAKLLEYAGQGVRTTRDYSDLLRDPELDAVIIAAPNDQHCRITRDALGAGKHVCCEKPLAISSEEAEELSALAWAVNKTLFTGFHRRYNRNLPGPLEKESMFSEGITEATAFYCEDISQHSAGESWYRDIARSGGGCVIDNGPNILDAVHYMFGEFDIVGAQANTDEMGVDMASTVDLVSARGIPIRVCLDWEYRGGERKGLSILSGDGRRREVDFLAGFDSFKGSLWHEYVGLLNAFSTSIATSTGRGEEGVRAALWVDQIYRLAGLR